MRMFWQDLRHGVRALANRPGFTAVAVLTLGLGIAANTTIYTLINAAFLRPLPFRDADRVVAVHERRTENAGSGNVSGHEYAAWRERNRTFESLAIYEYAHRVLTGRSEPAAVTALAVSANFFDAIGIEPMLGRGFVAGEDVGPHDVVILSEEMWRSRFAADRAVLGRNIVLDERAYTVIGVTPALGKLALDLWLPLDVPAEVQRVGRHGTLVVGRLRDGVSLDAAQRDLDRISRETEHEYPEASTGHGARVETLRAGIVEDARKPAAIALGAVAFVLLIACANVAHLLLTRAAGRQREIAVRAALGAGRLRLMRQLLAESITLSLAGGLLGVLVASWLADLLPRIEALEFPRIDALAVDWRVLSATFLVAVVTGILSGIVPALRGSRPQLHLWLSESTRSTSGVSGRLGELFAVTQIALAVVLVVGAMLMIQTVVRLLRVDPGFATEQVLAIPIAFPPAQYRDPAQQRMIYNELTERVRHVAGVQAVGLTSHVPLRPADDWSPLAIEGQPEPSPGNVPAAALRVVNTDYFRTMDIEVLEGRHFADSDARLALPLMRYYEQQPYPARFDEPQPIPVAIVSEELARRHWPGQSPLGRRVRVLESPWLTVIGVVDDALHTALNAPPAPTIYLLDQQEPRTALIMMVRTNGEPALLTSAIRTAVRATSGSVPLDQITTMDAVLWSSVAQPRFLAGALGVFAAVALLLSMIGTYGVVSYAVAQRTREFGIRSALGASAGDVLRLVLGRAVRLTALGIAIGWFGAFALTQSLSALLFDIQPRDPLTLAATATLLAAVSLLASYLPARRALRVDPLVALRHE